MYGSHWTKISGHDRNFLELQSEMQGIIFLLWYWINPLVKVFLLSLCDSGPYRIIEWCGSESTFKDYLDQLPCRGQGHLSLHQVAQSSVQPDLENFD